MRQKPFTSCVMRWKITSLVLALVLVAGVIVVLANWLPHREELARQQRIHRNWEREYSRLTAEHVDPALVRHFRAADYPDSTSLIDAVRRLVHGCSLPEQDTGIAKHGDTVTGMIAAQLKDPQAPKPHLKCDHQANIMIAILQALGMQARLVHAFSSARAPALYDHSFLEVRNPDSGAWEIQDPYYNVYWKDLQSGRRAVLLELVLNDPDRYAPCRDGVCDATWEFIDNPAKDLFQAMVFDYSRDKRRSVSIVNSRRFNLETLFTETRIKNAPFGDFLREWIDPIVIVQ